MKFVKATCPGCGGRIQIADNLASADCPSCGSKIILDWEGQTSIAVHMELGKAFWQARNIQEADKHFSLALEKNPRSGEAWYWKSLTARFVDEAKTYFQKSSLTPQEMVQTYESTIQNESAGLILFQYRKMTDTFEKEFFDYFPHDFWSKPSVIFELFAWIQELIGVEKSAKFIAIRQSTDHKGKGYTLDTGVSADLEATRNEFLKRVEMRFAKQIFSKLENLLKDIAYPPSVEIIFYYPNWFRHEGRSQLTIDGEYYFQNLTRIEQEMARIDGKWQIRKRKFFEERTSEDRLLFAQDDSW